LAAFARGARRHTDDDLYLEWRAPLALFRDTLRAGTLALRRFREPVLPLLPPDVARADEALVASLRQALRRRDARLALAETLAQSDVWALGDPYLAAGIEYLRAGRPVDAVGALTRASARNLESGSTHLLLGEAYRLAGLEEAAAVAF